MSEGEGRCEFVKPDGERCRARPRAGARFCPFHDPDTAERRREGRQRGGRERSRRAAVLPEDAPDLPLNTMGDVRAMLGTVINLTLKGKLDVRVANAAGYLGATLLRSIEGDELARRIEALEAAARRKERGAVNGRA